MNEVRNNLSIAGAGTVSGGVYGDVSVSGTGSVRGDLDCASLKVAGTADIDGNLKTGTAKIGGTVSVKGCVEAEHFKIGGSGSVHGDLAAKTLRISGSADVRGNVTGEKIEAIGGLKVQGDCSAEEFFAKGGFSIDGLLNAGKIDIDLRGRCRAREIGGEEIVIKMGWGSRLEEILRRFFLQTGELVVDTIEGDEITLEHTRAKVVRGNKVVIGTGCEVDLVEYKVDFRQLEGAQVKENRKL